MNKEIEIPEGYDARIEGNRVIIERRESEDEKIRKELYAFISSVQHAYLCANNKREKWLAYLEKHKEQKPVQFNGESLAEIIKGEFEGFRSLLKKKGIDYEPQSTYWERFARLFDSSAREYLKEQKPIECIEFDNEFKNQVSHLLASVLNKEHDYTEGFVKYVSQSLLEYAKNELKSSTVKKLREISTPADENWFEIQKQWEKEDEQKSIEDAAKEAAKDKESAEKFLNNAGIVDENGNLAEIYRSEQKPAEWSEEDERILKGIIGLVDHDQHYGVSNNEMLTWLKSLPERFNLGPMQEWSEEEMKVLDSIIDDYKKGDKSFCGYAGKIVLLNKIRDGKYNLSKQEWSEEDEKFINDLCNLLASLAKNNRIGCYYAPDIINKIKSLRLRPITYALDAPLCYDIDLNPVYPPINHWKPSEEQMKALKIALQRGILHGTWEEDALKSLHNVLKELI